MGKTVRKDRPRHTTPVAPALRLRSLDALRGFSVLGILVVNIQSFAMVEAAYLNPTAYGDLSGANGWSWWLSHVFADRKHLPIFAALFACGLLQIERRTRATGRHWSSLHYRRMRWLAVIGLLHAWLLWPGDILLSFAVAGSLVSPLRRMSPRRLAAAGLLALAVASLLVVLIGQSVPHWSPEAVREQELEWRPDAERIRQELAVTRGGWTDQLRYRLTSIWPTRVIFLFWSSWQNGAMMLIGMALFKWGFFTGERPDRTYWRSLALGLGAGLPMVTLGAVLNFRAGWRLQHSMFAGSQLDTWGSLLVALGYCAGFLLLDRRRRLEPVLERLAEIGRMALSNYLLQSLICGVIFYGYGLGLAGRLERTEQLAVVAGVWAINLTVSRAWLRRYRFGPVEWLWRSLTYRKIVSQH